MLTRIYVDNFRCLSNFECKFGPQQLILGPNGAGKSTLFDVLELLRDFSARGTTIETNFVGNSRTRWLDTDEQTFELDVVAHGDVYKYRLVMDSWGTPRRPRVVKENVTFSEKPIFQFELGEVHLFNDQHQDKVQYPFDWHRSALATIAERKDNTRLSWFKNWLSGLLVISPDPRQMHGVAMEESESPDRYLKNFANWYRHLRQETADHAYLADLAEVVEGFVTMRLENAGERRREIKVQMLSDEIIPPIKRRGSEYLLSELSDGQRVLIGLYAVLHFGLKAGITVCFDEPDNFIALHEIQPWLTRILDHVEDEKTESQVLIASHHPELINRMAFKEGIYLDRPQGRHTRSKHFGAVAETGLSASELITRGWERE